MGYTSVAAIQSEFKAITFSTNTAVTTDDVTEFIVQEECALEAAVAGIYEIPLTGTRGISIMKLMATLMVKARILDILPVKVGKVDVEQGGSSENLRERVKDMLDKIQKRVLILTGESEVGSGGVRSNNVDIGFEPVFSRDNEDTLHGLPNQW